MSHIFQHRFFGAKAPLVAFIRVSASINEKLRSFASHCRGRAWGQSSAVPPARCGQPENLRWAAPERNAATGADMWVSHRTGRPPGAVLRSGEAYEDLLAALGVEADSGLDRAGIVFLGKRVLL